MPAKTTNVDPLMSTYSRFPVTLKKGKGSFVWDINEQCFLDYTSGIATCNLGHVPDSIKDKMHQQIDDLWHCSNLYHIPMQQVLAEMLVQHSFADQVFFCNSGAEANEAAIKLARRYSQKVKQQDAYEIVTFLHSFHGRTLATLSATGQPKIQDGFYPLVQGFRYLPYNDFNALGELNNGKTCAVMLELVQGEGGVIPADRKWLAELAALCKKEGILLMIDEIQTGMGRTGTLFAYEQYGIEPDVMTLAKGLGSGFPIGAVLAKAEIAKAFDAGSHGSTFGGNPLAVSAGAATMEVMLGGKTLKKAAQNGEYLKTELNQLKDKYPEHIKTVRGKGLLLGIVTPHNAIEIVNFAREKNVLILTAGQHVIRILPPLTTTKEEMDQFITVMDQIFQTL